MPKPCPVVIALAIMAVVIGGGFFWQFRSTFGCALQGRRDCSSSGEAFVIGMVAVALACFGIWAVLALFRAALARKKRVD